MREGFNIIATANTRDRGVNEMSAALKRRFDFETVFPIMDFAQSWNWSPVLRRVCWPIAVFRIKCLTRYWNYWSAPSAICVPTAKTSMDTLTAIMSTAEAVNVAHAVGVRARF